MPRACSTTSASSTNCANTPLTSKTFRQPAVAAKIKLPVEQVFKTLLISAGGRDYIFAVIPGDAELDFKKLARAAGVRQCEMAALKDVQPLTGYVRGGVTVLGAKKGLSVPLPMRPSNCMTLISVSSGQRGLQLLARSRRISASLGSDRRAR